MTSAQGTMGVEVPLLLGIESTVSSGALGVEVGATPAGVVATVSAGALTPVVAVALTGQTITASSGQFLPYLSGTTLTVSRGTLVPEVSVALTGYAMTVVSTSPGFVTSDSTHVVVGLLGFTPAIAAGVATPNVLVGSAELTFTQNPTAVTSTTTTGSATLNLDYIHSQWVPYAERYVGAGEDHDGSGADWATVLSTSLLDVNPAVRASAQFGLGSSLVSLNNLNPAFNGNAYQTFNASGLEYSAAPRKWGLGHQFGVGSEGNIATVRTRIEDRYLTNPARTRYFAYMPVLGYSPFFWLGIEHVQDIDDSLYESVGAAADGPVNNSMGLVALRPTTPTAPLADTEPLHRALVFYPSLWNNGVDNWVPTYAKLTVDVRTNSTLAAARGSVGNDIQLRAFTGVTELWAMQNGMVVTHSGYGEVAYIAYLASTSATPRVPAYVGVIVMDLETQEVFAHTLEPLGAVSTPYTPVHTQYDRQDIPHRAVSDAVKLSDGRSFTQFALRGFVVNLAWTAGTHRNPVVTPKDGPSTGGGANYLARGVDTLEVKGDTALHVMWRVNKAGTWAGTSTGSIAFRPYVNDITSTGSTWTLASNDVWTWTLSGWGSVTHYPAFYSGSKLGKQAWFYQSEYSSTPPTVKLRGGQAWIDFWSEQPDPMTVATEGRVGQMVPVVTDCGVSVALTGHQMGITASNGLISGANKTVALTGHQINANYTCPVASVNVTVPLVGYQMECAQGRMSLIGDPVEVRLTGLHMCMQMNTPSTLPPGTVQLAGFAMTASGGSMVPHISVTLTGQACTASGGTLDPSVPLFTGLEVTASGGTLKPAIAVTPAGQVATAASGSLGVTLGATLTGQSATASRGTLVPHVSVALTGHTMTASVGTLTPTCGVTLTGQQATCAQGASAPGISVRMSSLAIVSASGAFVPLHTVNLASNLLTASKGDFVVFMARALSGQVMTVQQGTMGLNYDCNITLGSVQARGQVGSLATNLPTPAADVFLWANDDRDDELFAVVSQLGS